MSLGVVKIFDKLTKQIKFSFLKTSKFSVKQEINTLKTELNEHLEAINGNTGEITASYVCMNEVNDKLEKLTERLERIEIFLQMEGNFLIEEKSFDVKPLTNAEQQVFLVIYALEDEKGLVSYPEISRKTGMPSYMISEYISRLVEKGLPIMKKYVNNIPYIKLNPDFKRLQAKENILMIDTAQKELLNF